jgi:hypothetical protein
MNITITKKQKSKTQFYNLITAHEKIYSLKQNHKRLILQKNQITYQHQMNYLGKFPKIYLCSS